MEIIVPLSGLFNKSSKKQLPRDAPFGSPAMLKECYDAGMEFVKVFTKKFRHE